MQYLWTRTPHGCQVSIPVPPLTSYVTLGKLLNLSEQPYFIQLFVVRIKFVSMYNEFRKESGTTEGWQNYETNPGLSGSNVHTLNQDFLSC